MTSQRISNAHSQRGAKEDGCTDTHQRHRQVRVNLHDSVGVAMRSSLAVRVSSGTVWESCLGCGAPSAIKIVKRCGCCTSRDECRCAPQWCEECLLKWWLSSNQKRVERSTPAPGVGMVAMGIDPRWTARCPTCRASFCLNDVIPVEVRVENAL